jgi:hypothetical protein
MEGAMIRVYVEALLLAVLAAAAGVLWGHHLGADSVQARWDADKQVMAARLDAARAKQGAITTHMVTQYVDRVQVVHERGAIIVKRIPVYVTAQADNRCIVPRGFVRLHDAAAAGTELPASAGSTADAPSGVALSAVARVVSGNYTACRATAERLIALQAWATQQAGVSQ